MNWVTSVPWVKQVDGTAVEVTGRRVRDQLEGVLALGRADRHLPDVEAVADEIALLGLVVVALAGFHAPQLFGRIKHPQVGDAGVLLGDFPILEPQKIDLMDVAPNQIASIAASLIPFLEHDDANRALMGKLPLKNSSQKLMI